MSVTEHASSAIFRALRSVDVDPELAYEAVEEVRHQAGENVTTEIKAAMNARFAEIDVRFAQIDVRFAQIDARFAEINARLDTLASRMDTLQKVLWPLVVAISVALLSSVGGGLFALFNS